MIDGIIRCQSYAERGRSSDAPVSQLQLTSSKLQSLPFCCYQVLPVYQRDWTYFQQKYSSLCFMLHGLDVPGSLASRVLNKHTGCSVVRCTASNTASARVLFWCCLLWQNSLRAAQRSSRCSLPLQVQEICSTTVTSPSGRELLDTSFRCFYL